MSDSLAGGLWLTIIDMLMVFLVLYVLALIIKVIKLVVAPFGGDGPNGNRTTRARDERGEVETAGDPVEAGSAGGDGDVDAETTAVISAALAVFLERPETALVIGAGHGDREESPWAMAGRTRIMQSRELAKRRASA